MNNRTKEIRDVLLGYYTFENERLLMPSRKLLQIQSDGVFLGSSELRLLGLQEEQRQYLMLGSAEETEAACVRLMLTQGPQVLLPSAPDTLAVLHRPVVRNPSILTAESRDGCLLVCCYTARTPLAAGVCRKQLDQWEAAMGAAVQRTVMTMLPQGQTEEKQRPAKHRRKHSEDPEQK